MVLIHATNHRFLPDSLIIQELIPSFYVKSLTLKFIEIDSAV